MLEPFSPALPIVLVVYRLSKPSETAVTRFHPHLFPPGVLSSTSSFSTRCAFHPSHFSQYESFNPSHTLESESFPSRSRAHSIALASVVMECCLSESEHSAETDKDTTGSEYEDPDTDVTEPSTDSDDDLDAPETEWLLDDDHSRPAQYWKDRLKRLQREGLDFSTLGDYSEGTTNLLNRIEEQWEL